MINKEIEARDRCLSANIGKLSKSISIRSSVKSWSDTHSNKEGDKKKTAPLMPKIQQMIPKLVPARPPIPANLAERNASIIH